MPAGKDKTKSVVMSIRLDKPLYDKVLKLADGESTAAIIRKALRAYVAKR